MNIVEAIKHCKEIIKQNTTIVKDAYKSRDINTMQLVANCDKDNIAIETILNELEKKDKQIGLMAEKLVEDKEWYYSEFDNYTKQDFIEYFSKKVDEENE